ncbi:hypothetical protein EDB19DRAFT_1833958 [Suillus lakei]|nr:hypothetical protein EDB19DRAFT_1833958 [Suillus lakei]
MYEAYGKLIIGNEQRNGSISTTDGMYNRKLESGENLYGDIQKEKENGDEMEMSDGDGIGASEAKSASEVKSELDETFGKETGVMLSEGGTIAGLDSELEELIEVGGSLGGMGLGRGFIRRLELHQSISKMNNKLIKTYRGFLTW